MLKQFLKALVVLSLFVIPPTLASAKTVNVRVNPLGLLFGVTNAGIDVALTNHFTLGVEGQFFEIKSGSTEAQSSSYGARAQYFFTEALADSWYLAGFYNIVSAEAENTLTNESASVDGSVVGGVFGYMWMWSNFNIQLGFGYQSITIEESTTASSIDFDALNTSLPVIEFNLGWAF